MSATPQIPLADHDDRERFISGLAKNFGVIAPAGVGKTHSIVSRIVAMAQAPDALEVLPSLVVVTYTNRAAQEMQRRARARILEQASRPEILGAFNRAFFGTIHSFCLRLLQSSGHAIGVPGRAQLLEDDAELWSRFTRQPEVLETIMRGPGMEILLRHIPVQAVFALARDLDPRTEVAAVNDPCPDLRAESLLAFVPEKKVALKKIAQDQAALSRWLEGLKNGDDFLPLLQPTSSSASFVELWQATMTPLRRWLGRVTLHAASRLAQEYQAFRAASGFLTFQDQITLAADLLTQPAVARSIRAENYHIILDEAQDTDPEQFFVLLESAKHAEQPGDFPQAGHFAMVGDHQQSIYGKRADLAVYRKLHSELTRANSGEESRFSVTFRCAEQVVDFVNGSFPNIFTGKGGQVDFVPLQARPQATRGQVVRLPVEKKLPAEADPEAKISDSQRAHMAAKQIAAFIHQSGLSGLRAREWGQVAILCPRKLWFAPLVHELKAVGIPCQLHSMREIAGDSPAYAWFCALMWVMAHPRDGYEVVGVLREIFGLSDHDLAVFADGRDGVFQIAEPTPGAHPVAERLNALTTLRAQALAKPLRDGVRLAVEGTHLRERLRSLPVENGTDDFDRELNDLLIYASMIELQDDQWLDFAQRLKDGFDHPRETETTQRHALQLMTCQKAKGLEWDAVIVPFLFRKIRSASPRYPQCWKEPGKQELTVLLSGDDLDDDLKFAAKEADRQEFERLLYVTCTRARETLVLTDDRAVFDEKAEDYWAMSFGNLLIRPDELNQDAWKSLPTEVIAETPKAVVKVPVQQEELDFAKLPPVPEKVDVTQARQLAQDFPRRVTPHALAKHFSAEEPEARLDREPDRPEFESQTPATIYGTWWHGLMEALPWNEPRSMWQGLFEQQVDKSSDPERSCREWELFLQSTLVAKLNQPDWIFQPEMPFLWRANAGQVIEGVMDLAVFDPKADEWLVVDWKTNRLGANGVNELVEIYRGQVEAYLQALRELFRKPVRGILYSTTRGEWIEVV